MRAAFALALAGAAIAAPTYGNNPAENVHIVLETVVQTVYVSEGYAVPSATSTSVSVAPAPTDYPVVSTPAYQPPADPQPTYAPEPTPTPQPAPAPAPAPATDGYMAVVAEWRSKMGLKALAQSSHLEGTSMNTLQSAPGVMQHKLNDGVFGQTLAQGTADGFENVWLGGWMCERPNLPGLGDKCKTASVGWDYRGQTGHADILTAPEYTEIGCSFFDGIWCCDLAY